MRGTQYPLADRHCLLVKLFGLCVSPFSYEEWRAC